MRGKMVSRGIGKRADYVLSYKANIPLAVIEAKDANPILVESDSDPMVQAIAAKR